MQSEVEGQAMALRTSTPSSTGFSLVQVRPPLVVVAMMPSPTAIQSEVEGQATAFRYAGCVLVVATRHTELLLVPVALATNG